MQVEANEGAEVVLRFWFGTEADDAAVAQQQSALWWAKDAETDNLIRENFVGTRIAAIEGRLSSWEQTPRGRLALIILVDQFSRNLFRRQPEAFSHDSLARRWCLDGLARGDDHQLRPIERTFFYLPLEHSERFTDQERSVDLFKELRNEVSSELAGLFDGYLEYAREHYEIVKRFGRFPHRNSILARHSTAEELIFLQQPGSSF
jgi:uncharacterized protein (DUF924 family)